MTPAGRYDAVIVGGGHNGLTAAAYLARAGRRVLLLERLDHVGGAAVSAPAFDGVDARLSRYSYLVSLLPQRVIDELGLDIRLARRRFSSYTPDPTDPRRGLLVDDSSQDATGASFDRIGAPPEEAALFAEFYEHCRALTEVLWPSLTRELSTRSEARQAVADAGAERVWQAMIERPIGEVIAEHLANDLVRGVVLTDALIGTFARAEESSLVQNVCFLYHLVGGGTGEWDVPIGGMGAVTAELARAASEAGAELLTGAEVESVTPDGAVRYRRDGSIHEVQADRILSGVAPAVLERLLGESVPVTTGAHPSRQEGAQVKVNLLLSRLPRLRDESVTPEQAFGGTFHVNETWQQLASAYEQAAVGSVPSPLPCEIYCHTLADPSILSPQLRDRGVHSLTVFGLHVPSRLVTEENNERRRAELQVAVLASLDSVLAEPIESLLLTDAHGRPCIETKTTLDLERELGMPCGNIFHGGLEWPFLEDDAPRDTAAERWGVATRHPRILLCGSGARRGGGVSGIGGHNAAMAVLAEDG
ncbi:phytoene dehydrogenase-like protein [Homoserinimonas aerilata]|uniref:Phytoene dehydrogenase-like protein n=1 Tax=Homoserinimonas aerilata TaxID=1162970 RepID=A0A542XX70_9MICO|nr:NAD(P)/FAD-dependent oxidoreductase [Homoserinimonas aerilata]TQL40389.1 phytoene dehydrogenase-like protein [Homoserinimonas aerilata]